MIRKATFPIFHQNIKRRLTNNKYIQKGAIMNEPTNLWQLFALTGNPRHYLTFKQQGNNTQHQHNKHTEGIGMESHDKN